MESFDKMVLDIHNQYDSVNIVLRRGIGNHNEKERYQSLDESKELDFKIEETLIKNRIPYYAVEVDDNSVDNILKILNI